PRGKGGGPATAGVDARSEARRPVGEDDMNGDARTPWSDRWFRLLLRLYPTDFRDEMGEAMVAAYRQRAHASSRRGTLPLAGVWMAALIDSLRNGLGERLRPAAAWRRRGNWGRD